EFLVQQALGRLTEGRTTIVIAHRLSTVMSADRIVVIKDGQVDEEGAPDSLLARDGLFRTLYDHQFGHAEAR
ncbi:ABC transporter ATP-binding protein, partial [Defluviimonas sp. WL0024]|nr:ABC transporter ATP-binding protein [Defluviimonas sp. WL0024]MCU9850224.1 ABC transporter ATP-binding protein [Defluviimonas sp. WL0024]